MCWASKMEMMIVEQFKLKIEGWIRGCFGLWTTICAIFWILEESHSGCNRIHFLTILFTFIQILDKIIHIHQI